MKRVRRLALLTTALVLAFAGGVLATQRLAPGWDFGKNPPRQASPPARPDQAIHNVDVTLPDPAIANGVSVGEKAELYFTSGIGPAALNTTPPMGSPERFIDPVHFPGGVLTAGVTITEAQAMNALARIQDNLATVGLTMRDVITLRVFLDNAPGAQAMDVNGFNRAYRQFFANVNLHTGATLLQPRGTGTPAAPLVVNPVRPSRTFVEVASLPIPPWLVEVEAVAKRPSGRDRNDD
jgi:enamine deaminase RidA (YjgF/YER057c/UK114 family)